MFIYSESDIKLDKSQIFETFDKLNEEIRDLFTVEESNISCHIPVSEMFYEWYQKRFSDFYLKSNPCFHYYMSEDQRNRLLEDTKDGIPLPEGYYWDEIDPEKDTRIVYETWKLAGPGDYEATK